MFGGSTAGSWSSVRRCGLASGSSRACGANGGATTNEYDESLLYARSVRNAVGHVTTSVHDLRTGRETLKRTADGRTFETSYDGLGRPVASWGDNFTRTQPLISTSYKDGVPNGTPGYVQGDGTAMTFADGGYAVFTQCLAGFEHSLMLELAGTDGAIRTWWTGAMDRTETPDFELKLKRAGSEVAEVVAVQKSGEVFELEEQMRRLLVDVPARTPLVSAREARASQVVCLEIERALAERRAIPLRWAQ